MKHFEHVEAYFLYLIPNLSFQETYLEYIERRYSLKIHRVPSNGLVDWLRDGGFRVPSSATTSIRKIKKLDIENYLRNKTGIEWIATGEKTIDSVERNAMIRHVRGLDEKRRQIWPIAYWNQSSVFNYLKQHNIPLPPDYRMSAPGDKRPPRSFGTLGPDTLGFLREHYPDDYRKIIAMFPFLPACMVQR
jgi:phosphoadenosine phosphosulfate reductase